MHLNPCQTLAFSIWTRPLMSEPSTRDRSMSRSPPTTRQISLTCAASTLMKLKWTGCEIYLLWVCKATESLKARSTWSRPAPKSTQTLFTANAVRCKVLRRTLTLVRSLSQSTSPVLRVNSHLVLGYPVLRWASQIHRSAK